MTAEQFRPAFTTSQEAQEERAEERAEQGHYFGARITTTEGTRKPSGVARSHRTAVELQTPSEPIQMAYSRPGEKAIPTAPKPTGPDLSEYSKGFRKGSHATCEEIGGKLAWTGYQLANGQWYGVEQKYWLDERLSPFSLTHSFTAKASNPAVLTARQKRMVRPRRTM